MDTSTPDGLGATLGSLQAQTTDFRRNFLTEFGAISDAMRSADRDAKALSVSVGSGLRSAFDRAVFGGGKLTDVLRGLGRDISRSVVSSALKPVQSAIGTATSSLIQKTIPSLFSGLALFASGGAFSSGRVRAFAHGGVIDGPTMFPLRSGAGLMGEAGPEAVLPLRRGADGALGVAASGKSRPAQIVVNITTPDVESFQRSHSQISAMLARAVARGARNS